MTRLPSPALSRARATVVATEATTLGLSATVHLALILSAVQRPAVVANFLRGGLIFAAAMAGLGVGWLLLARHLRLGRSADPDDALWGSMPVALGVTLAMAAVQLAMVVLYWGQWTQAASALIVTAPLPLVALAICALRSLAALEGRSRTPVADVILATSHGLLGGLAACLLVGLLSHSLTAELTYELGVGTSMAAVWTGLAATRVLQGSRAFLQAELRAGRRWPTSQGGLRSAGIVLLLGVLVPSAALVTALLSARLTGVELACVALAVSVHTLRYATVTMRYGLTPSHAVQTADATLGDAHGAAATLSEPDESANVV